MKHSTLSKHPRRARCLFAMRSSISLSSLKTFWWCLFIFKLKGFYLIIFFFDGLLMSSLSLFVSSRRICGNKTLQQCLLKYFAFGFCLENNSSYIPSSLVYRSSFCESQGQLIAVSTVATATNWCLCWICSLAQWCLTTRLATFSYLNVLQTSLARVQSFLLIVTT